MISNGILYLVSPRQENGYFHAKRGPTSPLLATDFTCSPTYSLLGITSSFWIVCIVDLNSQHVSHTLRYSVASSTCRKIFFSSFYKQNTSSVRRETFSNLRNNQPFPHLRTNAKFLMHFSCVAIVLLWNLCYRLPFIVNDKWQCMFLKVYYFKFGAKSQVLVLEF